MGSFFSTVFIANLTNELLSVVTSFFAKLHLYQLTAVLRRMLSLQKFDRTILRKRLEKLDAKAQLAFAAVCCERLLPNYLAFIKDAAWGDIIPLRNALDLVWSYLDGKTISLQEIKNNLSLCELAIPDSEDFSSLYADVAQDASLAICELLDYLIGRDINKITATATYATNSVDLYVQVVEDLNPNAPDLEQKILTHRLMQRELYQQEKDLEFIEKTMGIDSKFLYQLKNSWGNNGKSNLDLSC
jgi:uncharacterized protein YjaG (DUF416 family)